MFDDKSIPDDNISAGSPEPDKSKSTRGDENKPVNSKAKSNQTHARTNDEEGEDSE